MGETDHTRTAGPDLVLVVRTPDPYLRVAGASVWPRTHPLAHLRQGDAETHEVDLDLTAHTVDRLLPKRTKLQPLAALPLEDDVHLAEAAHTAATARL